MADSTFDFPDDYVPFDPALFASDDSTGGSFDSAGIGENPFGSPPSLDDAAPLDQTDGVPTDLSLYTFNYDDGSHFDPNSSTYTFADGTQFNDVTASPDGTVLQFADGSIFDMSSKNIFDADGNLLGSFGNADESGLVANNNGAGSAPSPFNGGKAGNSSSGTKLPSFGGSPSGGSSASKAGAQQAGASALSDMSKLLSNFGSAMGRLLSGQASGVAVAPKPGTLPATRGFVPAPSASGTTTLLVIGLVVVGAIALLAAPRAAGA